MMAFHRRMLPSSLVNPGIGRAFAVGPDAEQRAERIERVEPPVEAEGELIEVGLQVLRFDAAMMRPLQPRLEVRKNEVDDGQVFLGDLGITGLNHGQMRVSRRLKLGIGRCAVRDDYRARLNGAFYKSDQRLSASIGDDFQPQAASVSTAAPHGLVALLGRSGTYFNGGGHDHGIIGLGAAPFAAYRSTDIGFVHFDVIAAPKVAADPITALAHHASPQLVQDLERGFVPAQAKLALELHGGHAGRHARNEVGRPKPDRQRRVRALHHGIDRQRCLLAAGPASQDAGPCREPERLALDIAVRTHETLGPRRALQVSRARGIVFEQFLEVPEGLRERQVLPLEHVSAGGSGALFISTPGITSPSIGTPVSLGTSGGTGGTEPIIALTTSAAIVAGDLVVVTISNSSGATITSVTDSPSLVVNNTYTRATSGTNGTQESEIWFCVNCSALASGSTITATGSTTLTSAAIGAVRIPGGLSALDVNPAGIGSTTATPTISTGALASSNQEIVFGSLFINGTPTVTEGPGFSTIFSNTSAGTLHLASKIVNSTASVAYSPTESASNGNVIMTAAFK
jgi:hypothetical protein